MDEFDPELNGFRPTDFFEFMIINCVSVTKVSSWFDELRGRVDWHGQGQRLMSTLLLSEHSVTDFIIPIADKMLPLIPPFPPDSFDMRGIVMLRNSQKESTRLYCWIEDVLGENGTVASPAITPLFTAIQRFNFRVASEIVKRHPEWINRPSESNRTPLSLFLNVLTYKNVSTDARLLFLAIRNAGAKLFPPELRCLSQDSLSSFIEEMSLCFMSNANLSEELFSMLNEELKMGRDLPCSVPTLLNHWRVYTLEQCVRKTRANLRPYIHELLEDQETKNTAPVCTTILYTLINQGLLDSEILECAQGRTLRGMPRVSERIRDIVHMHGPLNQFVLMKALLSFEGVGWLAELVRMGGLGSVPFDDPTIIAAVVESERTEWLTSVAFVSTLPLLTLLSRMYRIMVSRTYGSSAWLARVSSRAIIHGFVLRRLFQCLAAEFHIHLPPELWIHIVEFIVPVGRVAARHSTTSISM